MNGNWIIIRSADADDHKAVEKSAIKFLDRNFNIAVDINDNGYGEHWTAASLVEQECEKADDRLGKKYYIRLWEKCFGRAVGSSRATGFGWGSIGYSS